MYRGVLLLIQPLVKEGGKVLFFPCSFFIWHYVHHVKKNSEVILRPCTIFVLLFFFEAYFQSNPT